MIFLRVLLLLAVLLILFAVYHRSGQKEGKDILCRRGWQLL